MTMTVASGTSTPTSITVVATRTSAAPAAKAAIAAMEARYAPQAIALDRTDGVSFEFADWRFNLRSSNTEPLIRLNVEARGSVRLMQAKTSELLAVLKSQGAIAADT